MNPRTPTGEPSQGIVRLLLVLQQLQSLKDQRSMDNVARAIIEAIDKTIKPEDLWKFLQHLKTELRAEGFEVQ